MNTPVRWRARLAPRVRRRGGRALAVVSAAMLAAIVLPAVAAGADQAAPSDPVAERCGAAYLSAVLHRPGVTVDSADLVTTGSYTPPGTTTPVTGLPELCAVSLTETDTAGNPMHTAVWLPVGWNGRFQGIGGGGYSCGIFYAPTAGFVSPSLEDTVKQGYASASTDCGVPVADAYTGTWGVNADGRLNRALIQDWASTGIHDMTVLGKAVTQAFYASGARYSYFDGCSTGGREALAEAQQYPADYNGIVAGSPAINWPEWVPAAIWPALVMNQTHDALPTCKEDAFTNAVVQACGSHGIIDDPLACTWNADNLIGVSTPCGTITATDAAVMNKIWQGPVGADGRQLWYGLVRVASLAFIGATTTTSGVTTPQPFSIPVGWLGEWLQRSSDWNWTTLTYAQFDRLFAQSVSEFAPLVATDDPDLTAFNNHGGKIVIWHGLADELIPPQGIIQYYQRVQRVMGGTANTDAFARLFLMPGAAHCASAAGPAPIDPVTAVVTWVEHGTPPSSLASPGDPAALTASHDG
jgi:hypothetical protein